jgi:hypothetical protein
LTHSLIRLNAAPLRDIHDWLAKYQQMWSERFDAMDAILAELTTEEPHFVAGVLGADTDHFHCGQAAASWSRSQRFTGRPQR